MNDDNIIHPDELNEPKVIGGQLPENEYKGTSECALHIHGESGICMPKGAIERIKAYLVNTGISVGKSDADVIQTAMASLGVTKESELLEHCDIREHIGESAAKRILDTFFKSIGPADSTALLDNFNIDETLERWSKLSSDLFKAKFYHVPFQMIDFAKMNTELAKLDVAQLMRDGYDCFGVVLNTDVHSGKGKHWFCLYGDLKHKGTEKDPIVLEYFNSSGNAAVSEVRDWLAETEHELRKNGIEATIYRSVPRRLQQSQTECGVWSLMYILSRLKGRPPDWFYRNKVNDEDMIDVRAFLFRK